MLLRVDFLQYQWLFFQDFVWLVVPESGTTHVPKKGTTLFQKREPPECQARSEIQGFPAPTLQVFTKHVARGVPRKWNAHPVTKMGT